MHAHPELILLDEPLPFELDDEGQHLALVRPRLMGQPGPMADNTAISKTSGIHSRNGRPATM
jgi:hypothetical protein